MCLCSNWSKASSVNAVVRKLEEHGAMEHTIVVAATASDPAAMQFLAPFAGCSMGEYYRDRGEDALIIYDDLTKQAGIGKFHCYYAVRLAVKHIQAMCFYLHSRLLERAARVNADHVEKLTNGEVKGKTGSLTALRLLLKHRRAMFLPLFQLTLSLSLMARYSLSRTYSMQVFVLP